MGKIHQFWVAVLVLDGSTGSVGKVLAKCYLGHFAKGSIVMLAVLEKNISVYVKIVLFLSAKAREKYYISVAFILRL